MKSRQNINQVDSSADPENKTALPTLPDPIWGVEIGSYLSVLDKKASAETRNKQLFSIFKQDRDLADKQIKEALLLAVEGKKDELEERITREPRLLRCKGIVTDPCSRRVEGTLYRFALATKDISIHEDKHKKEHEEMLEMIDRLFRQFFPADAEAEMATQRAEQFPEGWKEKQKEREEQDADELKKVFDAIEQSKTDEDCAKAIQAFKDYLANQIKGITIKTGFHFNDQLLIKAYDLYDSNYNNFGGFDNRQNRLAAINVIGSIQSYFPERYVQDFCTGLYNVAIEKQQVTRKSLLDDKTPFRDPSLGSSCGVWEVASLFQNLCRAKASVLQIAYAAQPTSTSCAHMRDSLRK